MACRSVQVWFPRVSTSGGQSAGGPPVDDVAGTFAARGEEAGFWDLVMATQEAKGEQERQLGGGKTQYQ